MWGVEGGEGLPYVDIRMGDIGLNYRGGFRLAEKRPKTVESQAEKANSGAPRLYPPQNRYNALWTNGKARRVRF